MDLEHKAPISTILRARSGRDGTCMDHINSFLFSCPIISQYQSQQSKRGGIIYFTIFFSWETCLKLLILWPKFLVPSHAGISS